VSPKKILVIRFSAMGDVVLLVPVLRSLVHAHPRTHVTVVTRPKFAAFFNGISQVTVFPADVDREFKGISGLFRLFRKLHALSFDVVIDAHDHMRTKIVRTFFQCWQVPVIVFVKGRRDKKKFTRKENKVTHALPHTVERYHQAFQKAGLVFPLLEGPHLHLTDSVSLTVSHWLQEISVSKNEAWIGIAPFAMHRSKIWPVEGYKNLLGTLLKQKLCRFFLFGGGKKEIEFFDTLQQQFPNNVTVVAGKLTMEAELALMKRLDLMLCVDSSNMHLAALVGTPLLAIWGGTHPDVGFGPFQRDDSSILQISREELPCRPCSVYGKETCHRGDFACMTLITPSIIANRVLRQLDQ
jgi:ADP-heptose:LPS heptosyltransferase